MTSTTTDADRDLKARHRRMWAAGNYPELAGDLISSLGPTLVGAAGIVAGSRVLDVAAGSGNASIPAALRGAEVIASDLTPELFDAGRERAARDGVHLSWQEADAEALPFPDAAFDTVISCVGVMFAPHHQVAADELIRTCRPGGTIAVLNWTPAGFIGQMFSTMKPFAPAPPSGAQAAPLWGDEAHVRALFGHHVTDVTVSRATVTVDHFSDGAAFREYFKSHYGPTIAVYRSLADDPDRVAALDDALAVLADSTGHRAGHGTGSLVMEWEYLLVTARRKG